MLLNDGLCNHTSVGKIVMDGRLLSSAVLWLLPITLKDGSFKYNHVKSFSDNLFFCHVIIIRSILNEMKSAMW